MRFVMLLALFVAACGEDPPKSYDNYQACFDDQTEKGMLPVMDAIVACCLDHPIDGERPVCRSAVPDCINYLTANLNQVNATPTEVRTSCEAYIAELEGPQE